MTRDEGKSALEVFDIGCRGTSHAPDDVPSQHYSFTREQMRLIRQALTSEQPDKYHRHHTIQAGNCVTCYNAADTRIRIVEHHGEVVEDPRAMGYKTIGEYWLVNGKKFTNKPTDEQVNEAYNVGEKE